MLRITPLYGLAALVSCLFVIYCVVISWYAGPFRDLWVDFDVLRPLLDGQGDISSLFALHGGAHRLAVPRLFFLAEYQLFSGTNIFLISVSVLAQLSVVILIWRLLRNEHHLSSSQRWLIVAMTVLLMFNGTQLENFLYTFDMQWFLTAAAAIWALAAWIKLLSDLSAGKAIAWFQWGWCGALTAISFFSSFSGVCILLVLPVMIVILRLRMALAAALLLACVLVVGLYTQGMFGSAIAWIGVKEENPSVWNYLEFYYWIFVLLGKWVVLYLGSPLSRYSWMAAVFVVSVSVLVIIWYGAKLLRKGRGSLTEFQLICLAWCLFAIAVAAVTGWGRMYFINTANEDRYQTIAALYWLGFFGFACSRTAMFPEPRRQALVGLVLVWVFAWTLLMLPWAGWRDAQAQVAFFDRVKTANLAIATGQWEFSAIRDTLILGDKTKKINRPQMHAGWLKEKDWGVYSTKPARLLGTSIDLTRVSADACEGELLTIHAVGGEYRGYRLTGRTYDVIDDNVPRDYIIIYPDGEVAGLGRLERDKTSLWPVSWQAPATARWVAYTVDQPVGAELHVLAERLSGGYCRVTRVKKPVE